MKIRCDFVTNSSSSSFVIGKKDDTSATIESVFKTIKKLYKEMLEARDAAIEYIKSHPKMKVEYITKDDSGHFECTEKDWKKRMNLEDKFEKQCGLSTWDWIDKEYEWLNCETYLDYERYWLDKMQADESHRTYAPFTIGDFLDEKEITWLHFPFDPEYDSKTHIVNSKSSVIGWYFPYIEEAFKYEGSCDGCWHAEYCEYCKEDCAEQRELIANHNIPEDKACLYLLGRVCIHSESGYIPDYVVQKLSKISEFSCNHMG